MLLGKHAQDNIIKLTCAFLMIYLDLRCLYKTQSQISVPGLIKTPFFICWYQMLSLKLDPLFQMSRHACVETSEHHLLQDCTVKLLYGNRKLVYYQGLMSVAVVALIFTTFFDREPKN